jgi:Zn-dependent M28 family amino/carboxypeptidase
MRFTIYIILGVLFLFSGKTGATSSHYEITTQKIKKYVTDLCSDSLDGRLTGSQGEKLATQYIAAVFQHLHLEPAGDKGTFFQNFDVTMGGSLGKNNFFSVVHQNGASNSFILDKEWRPLAFSESATFDNVELIFAGFGIIAPPVNPLPSYNSYRNLNVKNKWVIVFRHLPKNISSARYHQLKQYSSLRYKAFIAKQQGAKGIIFVNAPNENRQDELIPLSFNTNLSGSDMMALSIKNTVLDELLKHNIKIKGQIEIKKNIRHGHNVLARLRINSHNKNMMIVGAHIDHLGHEKMTSSRAQNNEVGMIHPGADDNASGVASVLEAATQLMDMKIHGKLHGNKDILFAIWSGEELGALGSTYFVTHFINHTSLHSTFDTAINLDMVGHLQKNLVLQGIGSSPNWLSVIEKTKAKHFISLVTQNDPYLPTDSTSFYLHNVPTINFFTGASDNYHTPRDKPDTLNYDGIKNISEFLTELILVLEEKSDEMHYRAIQKPNHHFERQMKIYLGTIPNYASNIISGVKLSGVAKNSPAEQAGIKADDIIIKLADSDIHDIYDYTFALNALPVGKPVPMIVLRGKSKINLTIVAQPV